MRETMIFLRVNFIAAIEQRVDVISISIAIQWYCGWIIFGYEV